MKTQNNNTIDMQNVDNEIKKAIKAASDQWVKGLDERFNEFLQSEKFNIELMPLFYKQKQTIDKLIEALRECNADLKRMKRNEALDNKATFDKAVDFAQKQTAKYDNLLQSIEKETL